MFSRRRRKGPVRLNLIGPGIHNGESVTWYMATFPSDMFGGGAAYRVSLNKNFEVVEFRTAAKNLHIASTKVKEARLPKIRAAVAKLKESGTTPPLWIRSE